MVYYFFDNLPKIAKLWIFLTHDHMELQISKRYFSNRFLWITSKLYEEIAYHRGIQAITFLDSQPSLTNWIWHFESLTWESMGKSKMWNFWKTADSRAKRTKLWVWTHYTVHIQRVLLMPDSLSLVWGYSVHFTKIFNFTIKLCCSPNFYPISSKLYTSYPNHRATQVITSFLAIFQKIQKLWHSVSLTQDHMQLEISKCYFFYIFHWSPSKLYENIGKSKWLLEYCNEKLIYVTGFSFTTILFLM